MDIRAVVVVAIDAVVIFIVLGDIEAVTFDAIAAVAVVVVTITFAFKIAVEISIIVVVVVVITVIVAVVAIVLEVVSDIVVGRCCRGCCHRCCSCGRQFGRKSAGNRPEILLDQNSDSQSFVSPQLRRFCFRTRRLQQIVFML